MGIYASVAAKAIFPLFTVYLPLFYNPTVIDEIKGREGGKVGRGRGEKKKCFI